jgi:hypothetical protein
MTHRTSLHPLAVSAGSMYSRVSHRNSGFGASLDLPLRYRPPVEVNLDRFDL